MDMNNHYIHALELKTVLMLFYLMSILCFFVALWRAFKIFCMCKDRQDDQQSQNEEVIEMDDLNRIHHYENALLENESTDPLDI